MVGSFLLNRGLGLGSVCDKDSFGETQVHACRLILCLGENRKGRGASPLPFCLSRGRLFKPVSYCVEKRKLFQPSFLSELSSPASPDERLENLLKA